jgi:hypothetical protein
MKGTITITGDGKHLNFHCDEMLVSTVEKYDLISGLAKCLGINDPKEWAACTIYCLSRIPDQDGLTRTEIQIPDFGGR